MTIICGIDEAGRGPVIGPLVIAGAVIHEEDVPKLERIGVKDSKLLRPEERKKLYFQIITILSGYEIVLIPPEEVDAAVFANNDGLNLNWLEARKTTLIINKLHPDRAIVDCPSTNTNAYTTYLMQRLENKRIKLLCEHKADATHLICGAASILAKYTRDEEIERMKKEVGVDFGSGYPSDPATAGFLEKNWDKYTFFRKSWSSWQKYGAKRVREQKKLGEW